MRAISESTAISLKLLLSVFLVVAAGLSWAFSVDSNTREALRIAKENASRLRDGDRFERETIDRLGRIEEKLDALKKRSTP